MKIFVICGSQKFQFNRLIKALDEQVGKGLIKADIFAQIGGSDYEPSNFKFKHFIDQDTFSENIASADVIITHSGTGSIMQSINNGKKAIVVPRLAEHGEHVDNHQKQIAQAFDESGLVITCYDTDMLYEAVQKTEFFNPAEYKSNTDNVLFEIDSSINSLLGRWL